MRASNHPGTILVFFLTSTLLIATPALSATRQDTDAATATHPWIGEPAPDFDLPSTNGESVVRSSFKGQKFLVLHFAASW